MRLWQLDIPAVATLGANIGSNQAGLLNKYAQDIIVAPDSDMAGTEMVNKLTKYLSGKSIRILSIAEGKKDIGDMTDSEIISAYSATKPLDLALSL